VTRDLHDLSVLSRRGAVSPAEQRRLDVYLNTSENARLVHTLGCDYDRMQTQRPGDQALLERVRKQAVVRALPASHARRRWRAPALIALAILISGGAAAMVGNFAGRIGAPLGPGRVSVPARGALPALKSAAEAATGRVLGLPVAPSASAAADDPDPRSKALRAQLSHPNSAAVAPDGDASVLFSRANALRKSGNVSGALVAYAELRELHPASPEAKLSRVLSGRLLLARGEAERAADEFGAYLASNPRGTLAEEALVGKAQALRSLGRGVEERRTWELLLARFPSSIHASTARTRLSRDP
jgi:TolA-binding protein